MASGVCAYSRPCKFSSTLRSGSTVRLVRARRRQLTRKRQLALFLDRHKPVLGQLLTCQSHACVLQRLLLCFVARLASTALLAHQAPERPPEFPPASPDAGEAGASPAPAPPPAAARPLPAPARPEALRSRRVSRSASRRRASPSDVARNARSSSFNRSLAPCTHSVAWASRAPRYSSPGSRPRRSHSASTLRQVPVHA